ncbi:MAG: thioredoxin domain-containing protein [Capsulimonadales bacterium]|nr:thioredoxin domain-containing protein [Capsulimonadales bacterium]
MRQKERVSEEPFAPGDVRSACVRAARTKKVVLIDFYTTWCGPCKKLDAETWKDPAVRRWLVAKTVSRKIDAEKEVDLARRYRIDAYPTILLLRPDGREIDRLVGFQAPKNFIEEANLALAGLDSVARAKRKWQAEGVNNPMARMDYARALIRKGRTAEGLTEFLWCLDKGLAYDRAFYGVRLSFLLADILQLSETYPAARTALVRRRDAALDRLRKGTADFDIAMDFVAYNRSLGESEKTLIVYDALPNKKTPTAEVLLEEIAPVLIEKKRYADLVAAMDVIQKTDETIERCRMTTSASGFPPGAIRDFRREAVESGATFYEAAIGADRKTEGDAIRDKLIGFEGTAETFLLLVKRAARAGKPDSVRELVALARTKLSPSDAARVEKAATTPSPTP